MPSKQVKETDAASVVTTSTFSSTVGLLKESVKPKLPRSDKKQSEKKAVSIDHTLGEKSSRRVNGISDNKTPKQMTAEAYKIQASLR